MKKILCFIVVFTLLLSLTGCGKKKILHCDNCDDEIKVNENNKMDESWTIFCESCNEELFGDNSLLAGD